MSWFKVDDGLHCHKKTRRAGVEAMGLWAICGSWCADNLEDGFVPDYVAESFTSKAKRYAGQLVDAGYWTVAEKDGDKGWRFHDWDEYQPTRADVEEKREKWRERQRESRSRKRNDKNGHAPVTRDNDVTDRDVTRDESVSHAPVNESRPVPSRPVHTEPKGSGGDAPADQSELFPAEAGNVLALPERPTSQTLLGEWIEHRQSLTGKRPTSRVIGQLSKEVKALLDEGQPYADVRAGLQQWDSKGLHPSTLASCVDEARAPRRQAQPRKGDIDWEDAMRRAQARDEGLA